MGQNKQIVESFYSALGRGDIASAFAVVDRNVVWKEGENFLYADQSPYVGVDAVLSGLFARLGSEWENFTVAHEELVDGGDTVVAFGRYNGVFKATGGKVHAQFVHVFRLQDGKIAKFQQYTDTAQFKDATTRRASA